MSLLDDLKNTILSAGISTLKGKPEVVLEYLKAEGEKLAVTLAMITKGVVDGTINEDEARILLNQQKNASLAVLTAAEGISIIIAQSAINGILNSVKDLVNSKLPFPLL